MRTIKFRGKRTDNQEWVYGYYGITGEGTDIEKHWILGATLDSNGSIPRFYFFDTEVNPETVGQFTGLLDKNGVEIYENDIVNSWADMNDSYLRTVIWKDCGLEFEPLTGYTLCEANSPHFEVMGNIHTPRP